MESAVVAAMARENNISVLALRVIVDGAAMTIPASLMAQTDSFGRISLTALAAALLKQPGDIPDLIRLAKGFRAASGNLRWLGRHIEEILVSD